MFFRKLRSAFSVRSVLTPSERRTVEEIQAEWARQRDGWAPECQEIIDLALRRMRQDLASGAREDVIEEIKYEILYRQWCAENEQREAEQSAAAQPVPHGHGSL
jgi:hypothetical protein